jgi:hypothetical protein
MNKFLKYHVYFFEFLSSIVTIWILISLIYYVAIYRFESGISSTQPEIVEIGFDIDNSETSETDIKFKVQWVDKASPYDSNLNADFNGFVILNGNDTKDIDLKGQFNDFGAENCYLFDSVESAQKGIIYINDIADYVEDTINLILYSLIILFIVFMKVNLSWLNLKKIWSKKKKTSFSLFKYQFFFSYLIFHSTVLIILPTLNEILYDSRFKFCYSMGESYFSAMFFDRKFINKYQPDTFEFFTRFTYPMIEYKDSMFFMHEREFLKTPPKNNYVINTFFLCVLVWICQYKSIFANNNTITTKPTKKKKILLALSYILPYVFWAAFFIVSLLDLFDHLYLYHKFIFYSFSNLLCYNIFKYLFVFYSHVYLYAILLTFSVIGFIRSRRKVELNKSIHKILNDDTGLSRVSDGKLKPMLLQDDLTSNININDVGGENV